MSGAHSGVQPRHQPAQAQRGGEVQLPGGLPSWARAFPGTPKQASPARRFVTGLLEGSPLCSDAALVLSELFTNAMLHTSSGKPGGLIVVQVTRWRHGVRIAVTDQGSPGQPVIHEPARRSEPPESGHGLYLAAHLAQHLDWHDDASGRTVAAVLGQPLPRLGGPPPARPAVAGIPVGATGLAGG